MEMIDFLVEVARGAGEHLKGVPTVVLQKEGGGNFATDADMAAEEYILGALSAKFPEYVCLSEETRSTLANPEAIPHLFIIDPIDGTTNFARGLPCYCVSIAYAEMGVVQAGVVFDPTRNELFSAQKGKGAFLNGEQLRAANEKSLTGATINLGCPYLHEDFLRVLPAHKILHAEGARIVCFGSAALECAYVASGRLSGFFESKIKAWDIAAGVLLVTEAGGEVRFAPDGSSIFEIVDFFACCAGMTDLIQGALARGKT